MCVCLQGLSYLKNRTPPKRENKEKETKDRNLTERFNFLIWGLLFSYFLHFWRFIYPLDGQETSSTTSALSRFTTKSDVPQWFAGFMASFRYVLQSHWCIRSFFKGRPLNQTRASKGRETKSTCLFSLVPTLAHCHEGLLYVRPRS